MHRLGQLAALADLNITVPEEFARALDLRRAAHALPPVAVPRPGQLAAEAVQNEAARLVAAAAAASPPSFGELGTGPLEQARRRETEAADRAALAAAVRDAADSQVLAAAEEHMTGLAAAVQARHAQVVSGLVQHARKLPPGTSDETALRAGGQVRQSWIAVTDLAAEENALRQALLDLQAGRYPRPSGADAMRLCVAYDRSGRLYDGYWHAPQWRTAYGPLGTLPFWLGAIQSGEPFAWWLPSYPELMQRTAQLAEQMRAGQARPAETAVPASQVF
jgi:hypothetical protein